MGQVSVEGSSGGLSSHWHKSPQGPPERLQQDNKGTHGSQRSSQRSLGFCSGESQRALERRREMAPPGACRAGGGGGNRIPGR